MRAPSSTAAITCSVRPPASGPAPRYVRDDDARGWARGVDSGAPPYLQTASAAGVVIKRLPYAQLIARYDRPDTLFYLGPPYWRSERDYGPGVFDRGDFERLADQLAGIKGRFVLSLNDAPGVREVFGRFDIEAVETTYTIGKIASAKKVGEVLISG